MAANSPTRRCSEVFIWEKKRYVHLRLFERSHYPYGHRDAGVLLLCQALSKSGSCADDTRPPCCLQISGRCQPLKLEVANDCAPQARRHACSPQRPVVETERLKLRQWCSARYRAKHAMLSDPGTALDSSPSMASRDQRAGRLAERAVIAVHWALACGGQVPWSMKRPARIVGRVGPVVSARAGRALKSAGAVPAISAARAIFERACGDRLGLREPSSSITSSTASTRKTASHRSPRLAPKNKADTDLSACRGCLG